MDRFDPFVKYADVYGDIINWEKDPMNKPQNQNKYFFSDGKTYYEQICKMLRLMSVFKEAFNQIYSNEDEISEAWENFVNNLSASVVEGSEPDVTLTWTDDSVNFEFTMVPGVPGEQGVGITSISFNSDYTMTITLSDGNSYTSMSLKGETGPQGPQGETGSGLQILDVYATLADLQSVHPTGQPGDAYQVGSAESYTLYIWSSSQSAWVPAGSLGTVSPSTSNPLMDGTASAGSSNLYSRGDHVHPSDTSRASKEELDALIKTSQALIDQSFTYRESPAIQDGLARIDKIKGNTLVWNQIQPNNISRTNNGITYTYDNGKLTVTGTATATSWWLYAGVSAMNMKANHKYLFAFGVGMADSSLTTYNWYLPNSGHSFYTDKSIITINSDTDQYIQLQVMNGYTIDAVFYPQVFDLTIMFGAGKEPTVEQFNSLFPLPYYSYNQGSLLSFMGNGIKTVGKNQSQLVSMTTASGGFINGSTGNIAEVKQGVTYTLSLDNLTSMSTNLVVRMIVNGSWAQQTYKNLTPNSRWFATFTATNDGEISLSTNLGSQYSKVKVFDNIQLEFGSAATEYEPYTSSTLSLPISTYFPTGMKSAGSVYDELTETKAIKRVGMVDLGTLDYDYISNSQQFRSTTALQDAKLPSSSSDMPNAKSALYNVMDYVTMMNSDMSLTIIFSESFSQGRVWIKNSNYTDVTAFKTAMSGVYLYYELATPTETAVDLDLIFQSYLNGTEQLLPVNGSVPSTSPVIADMTYLSIDDAMEYILDKLANVPQNTQQILDSLKDDVADLQTDVGALQPAVSALQTSVGNINTNIGQLSSTVAGHTASISGMQSDISDMDNSITSLEGTIANHTSRIGTLESGLSTTNGNVQSLSSHVQSIDGRVTNLETDLLIVVKKEYDYDSVAGNGSFGVQTGLSQEPGYKIIGIVGSEVQQGEYTSADPWFIVTQAHVHYTSTGGVVLSMMARNVSEYTKTNVRVYLYLLCIKDIQSQ